MHRPHEEPPPPVRPHPVPAAGRWPEPPEPGLVDPAVLGALLARHGWRRRGGAPGRYARWTPPGPGGGGTSLLVPESRAFPDCEDLIAEALVALARSASPTARDVLVGLAVPSDEVHWWRDVPEGPAGAATWPAEERLRSAARQMLLAGALAARGRAGYHGARHRRAAAAALENVLVGTAPGGRRLTAYLPVGAGRPLAFRLHQALYAVREAVDYQRATGGMDAFDGAVEAGASHELTEAVVALVHGTEGARVAVEWSPVAGVPEGCAAHAEPVEFSPGDLAALRAASARYLREEPPVPVRITGAVVRVRRSAPRGAGAVRVRVIAGADVPQVRMVLEEESYLVAVQAHLLGLPIRVQGRLESRGGFRRLTGANGVAPVQVDEAERDRLMKSLQENIDFFEEACGTD
ncbi:PE-PGRS family protein OS=Streptomyces alboniger OX=132473 GN=CP975_05760 PE=4 SV=1 [Streptomyces alboniger]